jgi:hypothetical protein
MSADGSANRSARARLRRLDSQALLPRCSGYQCPDDPARQRRRARLPAKATTAFRGTKSGPSLCELGYLWSTRFSCVVLRANSNFGGSVPTCDAVFTQSSHQEARPAGGLGPGFRSQKCRHSGKMPHRPLRFANEPSFGEFPHVWLLRRERRTAVTLLSVSGGPFHA